MSVITESSAVGATFLAALSQRLPAVRLLTESSEIEGFRYDETEYLQPGLPLGVAFPRSTEDVATIVRLAADHGVPVVPRGAGTGLSGGAAGVTGALTIVLTSMNRILELDRENLVAVVQPGVINADLGRAAESIGLFYAPDPASFEMCTIGGNLAENSGGLRCLKYGVTRDAVLGLEVVLADAAVIRTGGKTIKDVAGYDLIHLFVGSEGTLGIITEATLRLRPARPPKLTLLAFFADVQDAGRAVAGITAAGLIPVTLELMDGYTIRAVDTALHVGLPEDAGAMLLIESDAGGAAAQDELDRAEAACAAAGAIEQVRATDPTEVDWLREARRKAHWSLEQAGVARLDDVGVPRTRVAELLAAIGRICAEEDLTVGVFGHAGDGNLHPTFVVDRDDPTAEARINAARARIYAAAIALGGTITGEHGTGLAKRAFLEAQRGPDAVRVMRAMKAALDPRGLLNPGKVVDV